MDLLHISLSILFRFALIWAFILQGFFTNAQVKKGKSAYPKDMVYIPGYTRPQILATTNHILTTKADSTLFVVLYPDPIKVPDFYISDHEVTNKEYRAFEDWVRDSMMRKQKELTYRPDNLKLVYEYYSEGKTILTPIYPDTEILYKDARLQFQEPICVVYFWHPAYNNYPIAGVSWAQANAYCAWLTNQSKINIPKQKKTVLEKPVYPHYRLPTESEWEFAATCSLWIQDASISASFIFPWTGIALQDAKGHYYANFGDITDQNGIMVKESSGDCYQTTKAKSFPANKNGLYDMAGNMAEWTMDHIVDTVPTYEREIICYDYSNQKEVFAANETGIDSILSITRVLPGDDLQIAESKISKRIDYFNILSSKIIQNDCLKNTIFLSSNKTLMEHLAATELHNAMVIKGRKNLRIVKGGSWATGPVYMEIAQREVFPENKCSSHVGFRVAMDVR